MEQSGSDFYDGGISVHGKGWARGCCAPPGRGHPWVVGASWSSLSRPAAASQASAGSPLKARCQLVFVSSNAVSHASRSMLVMAALTGARVQACSKFMPTARALASFVRRMQGGNEAGSAGERLDRRLVSSEAGQEEFRRLPTPWFMPLNIRPAG